MEHNDHTIHITPKKTYFIIFFALMILTAITTSVAFIDLGVLNTPVALAIAVTKATIVGLYFMHLKYSSKLNTVIIVSAVVWLAILFVLTLADYLSRGWSTM